MGKALEGSGQMSDMILLRFEKAHTGDYVRRDINKNLSQ